MAEARSVEPIRHAGGTTATAEPPQAGRNVRRRAASRATDRIVKEDAANSSAPPPSDLGRDSAADASDDLAAGPARRRTDATADPRRTGHEPVGGTAADSRRAMRATADSKAIDNRHRSDTPAGSTTADGGRVDHPPADSRRRADRASAERTPSGAGRRRVDREPGSQDIPAPGKPARRRADREVLPPGEVVAGRRVQRARDPEARRRDLAAAALEVIAESGIARTTHRAVAARAGLPLGATTYYFPTLDDLIAAGLQRATAEVEADFAVWAERLRQTADVPDTLAGLIGEYLSDRRRAQIECDMYVAAGRDPALRPLAMAWITGMRELLEPYVGPAACRDLVALLDGVMLQALISGEDVDVGALTATIRRLTAP